MQNLPPKDQDALASQIKSIQAAVDITPTVKAALLGLSLIDVVGEDVLASAVSTLRTEIK